MRFGAVPVDQAADAILAHSLRLPSARLAKGQRLTSKDIAALKAAGVDQVIVAQQGADDVGENAAANCLGAAFGTKNTRLTDPVSGRVNLISQTSGIWRVNASAIAAFNQVDEAITVATLPDYAKVAAGTLLATIKIIPYAAAQKSIDKALRNLGPTPATLHPFKPKSVALILTQTPDFKPSLLQKGEATVNTRLAELGLTHQGTTIVPHTHTAVSNALSNAKADMILLLGASATSDRADVVPAALEQVGGSITRFGMPVDPGNLLLLGSLNKTPVIGLPGCARSPALNGADWVLERLAADLPVTDADIAAMGVGGLLKEVPMRPHPRRTPKARKIDQTHILVMAAGRSRRMGAENKLSRTIDAEPLLHRVTRQMLASTAHSVTVVSATNRPFIKDLVADLNVNKIEALDADTGLAASLRAGIASLPPEACAVIVALGDMPDVTADHINALIAAHNPATDALIVAPIAPNGKRGNPVLFDRRYFESLTALQGDQGARSIIDTNTDVLKLVQTDAAVLIDLDTPEAWADWEANRINPK